MSATVEAECPECGAELVGGWFGDLTREKRCPECSWTPSSASEAASSPET